MGSKIFLVGLTSSYLLIVWIPVGKAWSVKHGFWSLPRGNMSRGLCVNMSLSSQVSVVWKVREYYFPILPSPYRAESICNFLWSSYIIIVGELKVLQHGAVGQWSSTAVLVEFFLMGKKFPSSQIWENKECLLRLGSFYLRISCAHVPLFNFHFIYLS